MAGSGKHRLIVKTAVVTFLVTVVVLTGLRAWVDDQIFGAGAELELGQS